MPIYEYKHPETGEIFEEMRKLKDRNKVFVADDGTKCKRLEVPTSFSGWKGDKEVFEADPGYVKKCKPKYVRLRNGMKVRYDPTKHC